MKGFFTLPGTKKKKKSTKEKKFLTMQYGTSNQFYQFYKLNLLNNTRKHFSLCQTKKKTLKKGKEVFNNAKYSTSNHSPPTKSMK